MNVIPTELPGVLILEPRVFHDDRGYFLEAWNRDAYVAAGLPSSFVQDNFSSSKHGVLRGLHYQEPHPQGKLVWIVSGEVFDVAVDIRLGSPSHGRWTGVTLSAANARQLWIPEGFAHGFVVTGDHALFAYKCTDRYDRDADGSIRWNDPTLDIRWPISDPILSDKDAAAPLLADIPRERMPRYI
ncbi:MAG TPA: dTDP-4-dehydrorhamnose 3,5-epimerase [Thermomicrobiales bacterium]|nr:dTDP-4-dehydrorhamnose 3,5-epimerase [Thermomicrobiales bacterium]